MLAKKPIQVPAFHVGDAINIVGMLRQDRPLWIAQEFDHCLRKCLA
jgi:hypothetical protein